MKYYSELTKKIYDCESVVFLKVRRDSRVTTGNSGFLFNWPRDVQFSFELRVHEEIRDEPRGWGHRPNAPDSPVRS